MSFITTILSKFHLAEQPDEAVIEVEGQTDTDESTLSEYESKLLVKHSVKKSINKKFRLGEIYYLKNKNKQTGMYEVREFVLKKIIYTVKDQPVEVLIMKQIDGPVNTSFVLSKAECALFHIKYEPGLQIWSMRMNWTRKK